MVVLIKEDIIFNYININYGMTEQSFYNFEVINNSMNRISLSIIYDTIKNVFSLSHDETRIYFSKWVDTMTKIIDEVI